MERGELLTQEPVNTQQAERKQQLQQLYAGLPALHAPNFWPTLEDSAVPLEVVVHCIRLYSNDVVRQRLLEIIVRRTQKANELWAWSVISNVTVWLDSEQQILVSDVCADLYEYLMRAFLDHTRIFWEENFAHALLYARKTVFRTYMLREGYWKSNRTLEGNRVPRSAMASIERKRALIEQIGDDDDIEDERAQTILHAVESSDLLRLVLLLPDKLKIVLLLLYWEGKTEQESAQLLAITERTIRNRVQAALRLLHFKLADERGR